MAEPQSSNRQRHAHVIQYLQYAALWIGLGLCLFAVWKLAPNLPQQVGFPSAGSAAAILTLLLTAWLCGVAAWRQLFHAFMGGMLGWRLALRQSGLLLVGKYIPGGIFGLLARASDSRNGESRTQLLGIGIYEQIGTITVVFATGLALMAAALLHPIWLGLVPAAPWAGLSAILSIHWLLKKLPLRGVLRAAIDVKALTPSLRPLLASLYITLASALAWSGVVAWLASDIFMLPKMEAIGLAGAFGVAVTAGVLAFFAPGGIGIREFSMFGLASLWLPAPQAMALTAILRLLAALLDLMAGLTAAALSPHTPGRPA
ncbi:hypothetical protein [Pseudoxanthomonas suwonensis]|uniref:Lysylphosphatidylglycerol synthetase family protein n=1 Tax=Pseudoxanthomonas suwonensis TaxID=314722 RepID=A0A0E3Z382_9GAMM|nr:hypothetical protein [Pseudoxanthomonas suwonensis]AKC87309.1 hypothetical protein WQ53_11625 [Pseudoxanthomonas suwonensis]